MLSNKLHPLLIKLIFFLLLGLSLSGLINSPTALVSGFIFSFLFNHPYKKLNGKAVNWLLKIAVVGLGFGMSLTEALNAGKEGFTLTVISIFSILILGYFLGKLLGVDKITRHLVSSGTAICGGSAIAAVAPIIEAKERHISIALGVVFILNSIALLIFPYLGSLLELSQNQFGLWAAIAIHDTSSVVGAVHVYGDEALKVATTVKLARALWIIPVTLLTLLFFKSDSSQGKIKIPWFIFLFIVAILINTYLPIPQALSSGIKDASKSLLVLTLFLIGTGLSIDRIKSAGWRPMILGILLWVIISIGSLLIILRFYA